MALAGVNNCCKRIDRLLAVAPSNTVNEETTASLAVNPVIRAVAARQSPNPSGAKIGAITFPSDANILSDESSTIFNLKSKVCKNQIIIEARKIRVKASC